MNEELISFASELNYQKLAVSGSGTVSAAVGTYATTIPIDHSLGKISSVRVWYDPGTGRRFPLSVIQYVDATSFNSEVDLITGRAYLTTTQLVIELTNANASVRNVEYWYRVYYD